MKHEKWILTAFVIISIFGCIALIMLNKYRQVYAYELEKIEEIEENMDDGSIPYMDESPEDNSEILRDTIEYIDGDEVIDANSMENSEDSITNDGTDSNEPYDNFKIMVIFGLGITIGAIVGHFLTGFIR